MKHRRTAIGIAILVGLQTGALLLYRCHGRRPATAFATEALAPRAAPDLVATRHDGTQVSLAALRGRPVLVHFWATWCPPCRDELPGLLRTAAALDLELLAISVDDAWSELATFFAGAIPRAVVRPSAPGLHTRFGASTLPDSYLVDREGRLVLRIAGARDWTTAAARAALTAATRP